MLIFFISMSDAAVFCNESYIETNCLSNMPVSCWVNTFTEPHSTLQEDLQYSQSTCNSKCGQHYIDLTNCIQNPQMKSVCLASWNLACNQINSEYCQQSLINYWILLGYKSYDAVNSTYKMDCRDCFAQNALYNKKYYDLTHENVKGLDSESVEYGCGDSYVSQYAEKANLNVGEFNGLKQQSSQSSGLSTFWIVVIVIGCAIVMLLFMICLLLFKKRRKSNLSNLPTQPFLSQPMQPTEDRTSGTTYNNSLSEKYYVTSYA
eukprot:NODE_554_length_6117_cov_0.778498.p1 type:complete len:262 gc:universal NODE_554_length_6117_cov_0.778498:2422-3207(+)